MSTDATTTADGFRVGRRVKTSDGYTGEIKRALKSRRGDPCWAIQLDEDAAGEWSWQYESWLILLPEPDAPATPEPDHPVDTNKMVEPPADDPVNHPKHYTSHPSGIECIEVVRHMSFSLGNVVKYAWRADLKCNAIEDLEKAVFYLNDEIEKRKKSTT